MANPGQIAVSGAGVGPAPGLFGGVNPGGTPAQYTNQQLLSEGAMYAPSLQSNHAAVIGDSYVQLLGYGTQFTSPSLAGANIGLLSVLAGSAFRIDPQLDNFGISGGGGPQLLQQLPGLLARRPNIAFIQGGHNDFLASGAGVLPTLIQTWTYVLQQLAAAGIIPVLILDFPSVQTGAVTNAQLRQLNIHFNQWKRFYALNNGYLIWDWNAALINPADSAGGIVTAYSDDGVHPNFAGNMAIAQLGLTQLAKIIPPPTTALQINQNDAYDATYNPYGQLAQSPLFLAGGGTLNNGFVGNAPAAWNVNAFVSGTGKTYTASLVTPSDGIGQWLQMAVSGTGTGGSASQLLFATSKVFAGIGMPIGTIVEGWVQVNVLANSPFYTVNAKFTSGSSSSQGNAILTIGFGSGAGPVTAWSGIIYIPPMVTTNTAGIALYLQTGFNDVSNTFSGTVQFRRPTLRIVQNPYS